MKGYKNIFQLGMVLVVTFVVVFASFPLPPMINHKFTSFSAVQIYDRSYIHFHKIFKPNNVIRNIKDLWKTSPSV